MEEHEFFTEDEIRITSTRLIVDGEIYVVGAITSIKHVVTERNVPKFTLAIGSILLLLGLILNRTNNGGALILIAIGFLILLAAVATWFFNKVNHKVIIGFL